MYTSCGKWVVFEMQTCFFIVVCFGFFIPEAGGKWCAASGDGERIAWFLRKIGNI